MSEKAEGTFKIKSKKKLTDQELGAKNREPLVDIPSNVTKVVIPKEPQDAIQEPDAKEVDVHEPSQDSKEVVQEVPEPVIKEITKEAEPKEKVEIPVAPKPVLPENITKLVSFMEETGGTMQDYIRLNTNYDDVDRDVLVKEYYKTTKSHLSAEEIDFMIDDSFAFDEDIDEERDIRRKKLAYKEEVELA